MALSLSENNQYYFNEINQSYGFSHLLHIPHIYILLKKQMAKKYVEEGLRLPKLSLVVAARFTSAFSGLATIWVSNYSCVLSKRE